MTECPQCGSENVCEPCGYVAECGRRVSYGGSAEGSYKGCKYRMGRKSLCHEEALRRGVYFDKKIECELRNVMNGVCPWEEAEEEPDPDRLREDRDERRRLAKEDNIDA